MALLVFSECVLNVGDSGQISVFLAADKLTRAANKRLTFPGNPCRQNGRSLVNIGQNMLHTLSLDANSTAISNTTKVFK